MNLGLIRNPVEILYDFLVYYINNKTRMFRGTDLITHDDEKQIAIIRPFGKYDNCKLQRSSSELFNQICAFQIK